MNSRLIALLAASCLGTGIASLDISIVNVALPQLQHELNTSIAGLQWIINAYAICLSAFMLGAGSLSERFGIKQIWLFSISLFTLASVACAMSNTLPQLLAGRAIQGIAGALLIPCAMPIITSAFEDSKQRANAIGSWSASAALALISGPLLGGLLLDNFGWHSIFMINLPLGVIALILGWYGIPSSTRKHLQPIDKTGLTLSVLALSSLTYGLIEFGNTGLTNLDTQISLAFSIVTFVIFFKLQRKQAAPLFPFELFQNTRFTLTNMASFALGFSSYSTLFFFSLYLQQVKGFTASQAGLHMLTQFVATIIVSFAFGRLRSLFGLDRLLILGLTLVALSLYLMLSFSSESNSYWICALFVVHGIGMGLNVPALGLAVMESSPKARLSSASAVMNSVRQTGMTLGIAILGTILSMQKQAYLASTTKPITAHTQQLAINSGFHMAMLGAGLLISIICILLCTPLFRPVHLVESA